MAVFLLYRFVLDIGNIWLAKSCCSTWRFFDAVRKLWSNWLIFLALKLIEELLSLCDLLKDWSSKRETLIIVANLTLSVAHTNTLNFHENRVYAIDTMDKNQILCCLHVARRRGRHKRFVHFMLLLFFFRLFSTRNTMCLSWNKSILHMTVDLR